ncbi:MAG: TGS domain-containing protein, partial [Chloroflexota bacterium]|nr:TGS domain-containing protein [Chloroflexota bacterium]
HWRYKEGSQKDSRFEERMAWLRQLMEWQREMGGAEQFLESVKTDVFKDQVFVYTPKGEIKELPAGSTPLDFAYLIHTELGHRCIGAKVNGRLISLDHTLQNGDTVEVLAAKTERGPSRDWLNPDLGYITSSHSREKVGQWFRKRARADNIALGRDILEKELRRLGLSLAEQGRIAALFHYEELGDFLAALGCGDISPRQVATQISPPEEKSPAHEVVSHEPTPASIQVLGVGDLLTRIAPCCHPIPGDEIIGYITRSRGVTVHRRDCSNVINEDEKERLIKVDWGQGQRWYPVSVRIEAWDKVGLLRDITTMVSAEGVNIEAVSNAGHEDRAVTVFLTLEISSIGQLARLLSRLESVPGVISATRGTEIKQV